MEKGHEHDRVNDTVAGNIDKPVFIHSDEYINVCGRLPKVKDRALMVHRLLGSYNLLKKMRLIKPIAASKKTLASFHCPKYIDCIEGIQKCWDKMMCTDDEDSEFDDFVKFVSDIEEHGIGYDCAPFERIFDFVSMVAGATIQCAEMLNEGNTRLAINLYGGWHHSHRDEAAGFCYVNDIVLGILKLREKFNKILYIDLDIHHGDGVEEAFLSTDKVMTVSFHKHEDGYFPGTGSLSDVGKGRGKYYTVNVPLKEGINDEQYYDVFTSVINCVKEAFTPEVIVCQCGADGLAGDPLGGFNLTGKSIAMCVDYIRKWGLPMMVLGGGGYNFVNVSKCWTQLIASLLNIELNDNIPDHEYFEQYAPLFDINVIPSVRKSSNTREYLQHVISTISENMENLVKQSKKNAAKNRIRHFELQNSKENKIARLIKSSPTKENKQKNKYCEMTTFQKRNMGNLEDLNNNSNMNNNNNLNNNSNQIENCTEESVISSRDLHEKNNCLRQIPVINKLKKQSKQSFDFDDDMF